MFIRQVTSQNLWHREFCSVFYNGSMRKDLKTSGHVYMCTWFTLLYVGNEYNIVNQLYSNEN